MGYKIGNWHYSYKVYKDSFWPYMGEFFNMENPTEDTFYVEIISIRYGPDDTQKMVQRSFLLHGFNVDNSWEFVESGWNIIQVIHKPTNVRDLPTMFEHRVFCKTL